MTSTTGSTFSVAVRGQVASCSLPQLAGMDVACKEREFSSLKIITNFHPRRLLIQLLLPFETLKTSEKYSYEIGPDWQIASGMEEGFSQLVGSETHDFSINLPLDCTFKATNPSGWPRLVIELIGPNFFGSDQPRGFW